MTDSGDMFGDPPADDEEDTAPSAAELEAAGQSAMFGDPAPAPASVPSPPATKPAEPSSQPYRVLARKYRPQTFSELIGQEPMVRTLANAIKRDRLAHAFLMTGVRGVGKTSTARLIAKALNCIGPDGQGGVRWDFSVNSHPAGPCPLALAALQQAAREVGGEPVADLRVRHVPLTGIEVDPALIPRARVPIDRMLAFTAAQRGGQDAGALVPGIGAA